MCPLAESIPPATPQTSSECKVFQRYIRSKWKSYPITKAVLQHPRKGYEELYHFLSKKGSWKISLEMPLSHMWVSTKDLEDLRYFAASFSLSLPLTCGLEVGISSH